MKKQEIPEILEGGFIVQLMKELASKGTKQAMLSYGKKDVVLRCNNFVFRGKNVFSLSEKLRDFMVAAELEEKKHKGESE